MRIEFPREEYRRRQERAAQLMRERGVDALFVTAEANVNYFAGFRHFTPWTTFTRPTILIVPRDREPVLIAQGFLAVDAAREVWFGDVRSYTPLTGTPIDLVRTTLQELGLATGTLACELGVEQRLGLPYQDFQALQAALPAARFQDGSDLIWQMRMIKSPAEVEALRAAGLVAARAYDRMFAAARAGQTEKQLAKELTHGIVEHDAELGFTLITSGPGHYDRVAGMPRDRAIEPGDFVWFDLGVVSNGYWSDHSRGAVVGRPTDHQRRNWDQAVQVTLKGVEAVGPGVPVQAVVEACADEARRLGLEFTFAAGRLGHGLGLQSTEPPHVAAYDATILQPGMAITVEPGWILDDGVYVDEENVVVTEHGHEVLTRTSRALRVIE